MTDQNPRRGRPSSPDSLSQADIQRAYRLRKKEQGLPTLAQALNGFIVMHKGKGCRVWRKWSGFDPLSWNAAQRSFRGLVLASEQAGIGDQFRVDPAPVSASEGVIYASS